MDSAVKGINQYNQQFAAAAGGSAQPQLNPANYGTVKDNLVAIAVCGVLYNDYVEQWNGYSPINFGINELKLITGGKLDCWDAILSNCTEPNPDHKRIENYYREALSGTCVTYTDEVMRGLQQTPNGSVMQDYYNFTTGSWTPVVTDGVSNYHTGGIPDLTCASNPAVSTNPSTVAKPGSGSILNAVNQNAGGIGYTFLQRWTTPGQPFTSYGNIHLATVNGASPFPFDQGNNLPGINGTRDVTDVNLGNCFYQSVVDGTYPLWAYEHIFDATNGQSAGLNDYIARFTQLQNASIVAGVGLLPISYMDTYAAYRSVSTSGPNANRGPGFGRCGFISPITGETVRDGMAIMLKDPNAPDGLPGEGYPDNRP